MSSITFPLSITRSFVPQNLEITDWEVIAPYFEDLTNRNINTAEDLAQWIKDRSELTAIVRNDYGWRYIHTSCDTINENHTKAYQFYIKEINPNVIKYDAILNKKLVASPFTADLDKSIFEIYLRNIEAGIQFFTEKNIPLFSKERLVAQKSSNIRASLSIEHEGKELTLQQAQQLLTNQDRSIRETIYKKMEAARSERVQEMDDIFDELMKIRHQIGINAGFENYKDYKFAALNRFDYTPQDCRVFHQAVEEEVVPLLGELRKKHQANLGLDTLRSWDLQVDPKQLPAIKPFSGEQDMIDKSIGALTDLDPFFGQCMQVLASKGNLDLETRKGKRPGGYNMTLPESGVPFIFMNSANSISDMRTMMHEAGHSVHSILMQQLTLTRDKRPPAEVAELAAMSMELLTMDYWDNFIDNKRDLIRAKIWELSGILRILPWIATVDHFQHWLYTNPTHTQEERYATWLSIHSKYEATNMDWTGIEDIQARLWQKQLHLYEYPFYYVEYGIAQLGAIAIWKNYKENPAKAIEQYIAALKLGNTRNIKTIYQTAGIEFNFSKSYIKELMQFLQSELNDLWAALEVA